MDAENVDTYYSEMANDPKRRNALNSIYLNKFGKDPDVTMSAEEIANAIIDDNIIDGEAYNTTREVLYMDERGLMKIPKHYLTVPPKGCYWQEDYHEMMKHLSKNYKVVFTGLQGFKTFMCSRQKTAPNRTCLLRLSVSVTLIPA